jgi:hypothetical protein
VLKLAEDTVWANPLNAVNLHLRPGALPTIFGSGWVGEVLSADTSLMLLTFAMVQTTFTLRLNLAGEVVNFICRPSLWTSTRPVSCAWAL